MRGHVAKKGRRWYLVYDENRTENGKRVQRWRVGGNTKAEAEQALRSILSAVDAGDYVQPSALTVGAFLEQWIEASRAQLRGTTSASYAMLLRTHVKPRLGDVKLQRLTPPMLNSVYADLLASGRRNGKGGLSPRTVRYVHTVLQRALGDAVGWSMLARNPASAANPPKKAPASRKPTWTAVELRRFLERVRDDRLYAAFLLSAMTGMRRGEVLGLAWTSVDLDGAKVTVERSLVSVSYVPKMEAPKTSRGRRVIALDVSTVAALREHRDRQLDDRVVMGADWGNAHDLVFTRDDGSPLHPQGFSEAFKRHVAAAGLPKLSLHGLRHTHATLALRAGVHPKVVSERLGHASVSFTLDVYTDALPDMQETAAGMVSALVFESALEVR